MLAERNIRSIEEYNELCEHDVRFPRDPEQTFGHLVARWSWVDYLGIPRTFYDLETCKQKCAEYLEAFKNVRSKILQLSILSEELCKLDPMFPPHGLWVHYYEVHDLRNIIQIHNVIEQRKNLLLS